MIMSQFIPVQAPKTDFFYKIGLQDKSLVGKLFDVKLYLKFNFDIVAYPCSVQYSCHAQICPKSLPWHLRVRDISPRSHRQLIRHLINSTNFIIDQSKPPQHCKIPFTVNHSFIYKVVHCTSPTDSRSWRDSFDHLL